MNMSLFWDNNIFTVCAFRGTPPLYTDWCWNQNEDEVFLEIGAFDRHLNPIRHRFALKSSIQQITPQLKEDIENQCGKDLVKFAAKVKFYPGNLPPLVDILRFQPFRHLASVSFVFPLNRLLELPSNQHFKGRIRSALKSPHIQNYLAKQAEVCGDAFVWWGRDNLLMRRNTYRLEELKNLGLAEITDEDFEKLKSVIAKELKPQITSGLYCFRNTPIEYYDVCQMLRKNDLERLIPIVPNLKYFFECKDSPLLKI